MSKAENIIKESRSSILRRSIIRGIIGGEEKIEYMPRLLFGEKNDIRNINSAVFIFPETDNTYSLQTDNFQGKLSLPSWDTVLTILRNTSDLQRLIKEYSLDENIKEIIKGLIICTIENMPTGGLLFCGENINKPSSVYFFCHPEIPEEFSLKVVIEKIEDQRELVREMM